MRNFLEQRLLFRIIQSENQRRIDLGQAPLNTTSPTGTSVRTAEANAGTATVNNPLDQAKPPVSIQQANNLRLIDQANMGLAANERERAAALANPQVQGVSTGDVPIYDEFGRPAGMGIGYTDVTKSPAEINAYYDQLAQNLQNQRYTAGANFQGYNGDPNNVIGQQNSSGQLSVYDPVTGQVRVTSNNTRAFENQAGAARPTTPFIQDSTLEGRQSRLSAYDDALANIRDVGSEVTGYKEINSANAAARGQIQAAKDAEIARQRAEGNAQAMQGAQRDAAATAQQATTDAALQSVLGSLPPEYSFLAPILTNYANTLQQSIGNQGNVANAVLGNIESSSERQQVTLNNLAAQQKTMYDNVQGLFNNIKTQTERSLTEQEAAARSRLDWTAVQEQQRLAEEKRKTVDAKVASLALRGGFGSSNGLAEIDEAAALYDKAISDVKMELGVQQTEIAAKFGALRLQATQDYTVNSVNALKDYQGQLERISLQQMTNEQARTKAENDALISFTDKIEGARQDYAKGLMDLGKQVIDLVRQDKSDKKAQQDDAFTQLKWIASTYGPQAPKSLLDSIARFLPDIDVEEFLNTPTLAQRKASQRSVGSSPISSIIFTSSESPSTGVPPTFDEYLRQKEAEAFKTFNVKERDKLRAEYDAKKGAYRAGDPDEILQRLELRTANSAKHIRENAQSKVTSLLNEGRYQEASRFVDGIGTPLSATERNDYVQALNARSNVLRVKALLDEFGSQGPITGKLKGFNLWSTKQAELNSLITQSVPGLARGIFKEVGVLTDQDIERYKGTIPNGTTTLEQAQALTQQLLTTIDMSIQNQLAVHRDSGLNVRDIANRFETLPGQGVNDIVPSTSADSDYVRSLNF